MTTIRSTVLLSGIIIGLCVLSFVLGGKFAISRQVNSPQGSQAATIVCTQASDSLITAQEKTLRLLQEYLQTGSPEKRRAVQNATGDAEILASRIFRWFETFGRRRGIWNSWESEQLARQCLLANPRLTLLVLQPVLLENPNDPEDDIWILGPHGAYFSLCAMVASIEEDGFALDLLNHIAGTARGDVAKGAADMRDFVVSTENYRLKSKSYKESKRWKDLEWLGDNKLKAGMTVSQVEEIIGKEDFAGGGICAYAGKMNDGKVYYLWMTFWDGSLVAWAQGGAPPDAMEEMSKKLNRDR